MKILVATKKTQGQRKNDFGWVPEGELVTFAFECDGEVVDGTCGCRRALSGVKSHKATSTFEVVEMSITLKELTKTLAEGLVGGGWYDTVEKAMEHATDDATELSRLAATFPVGAVLEKRGDTVQMRFTPKPPKKETPVAKQTKEEFIEYLKETLIPDLKAAGSVETAKDFETCLEFMGAGQKPKGKAKKPLFTEAEKMRLGPGFDEHAKERIRDITTKLVEGMVLKGELNPDDEQALKKAIAAMAKDARATYLAAQEYLAG